MICPVHQSDLLSPSWPSCQPHLQRADLAHGIKWAPLCQASADSREVFDGTFLDTVRLLYVAAVDKRPKGWSRPAAWLKKNLREGPAFLAFPDPFCRTTEALKLLLNVASRVNRYLEAFVDQRVPATKKNDFEAEVLPVGALLFSG